MATAIHDLPIEMLVRILMHLPAQDLAACAGPASREWLSLSRDESFWKYHCLTRWGYWKHAQEQLRNPTVSWFEFFKINCIRSNLSFLILGAEGGGTNDERLTDVQQKLHQGGLVNVSIFNVRTSTPTADYLKQFNAVLFFSYHGFDQVAMGNLLADFVDMGGGVVFCAYGNCGRGNRLDGKWAEKKYDPLTLGSTARMPYLKLGKVHVEGHAVMDGVDSFDGGELSSHGDGVPHARADVIAEWSNGRPLVVELRTQEGSPHARKKGGEIIGLNFYPPSSQVAVGGWESEKGGGARIMANALHYVARG